MRSPWKLVAGFMSRRSVSTDEDANELNDAVDQTQESSVKGPLAKAGATGLLATPSNDMVRVHREAEKGDRSLATDHFDELDNPENGLAVVGRSPREQSGATSAQSHPFQEERTGAARGSGSTPTKVSRVRAATKHVITGRPAAPKETSEVADALALNAEIMDLRRSLAVKLAVQNEQLSQLLRRYD